MNNQVSKLLDVKFPEPNHSNFNLGRKVTFSADVGYLIPCYVEEVLASSYKRLDLESLIQCNATVAPVMGSFTCKVDAYFVPIRIYHQHLLNNDRSNIFSDDFQFHYFPFLFHDHTYTDYNGNYHTSSNLFCQATSLLEYLGYFPHGWNSASWTGSSSPLRLSAYPFIGYFDIFRNYYANPYDENVPFRVNNALQYDDVDSVSPSDGFCKLKYFDIFVNNIRANSINSSGQPTAVNVFNSFNFFMEFNYKTNDDPASYICTVPLFSQQILREDNNYPSTLDASHYGLLRRTYKDDYFNARITPNFVEYLKEQSRVQIQNGTFDITQLRLANRIAKYVDKLGFSDSRFGSWLKAHFGTRLNDRLDIPQFLGSMSTSLVFNDVVSNAQTGNNDVVTSNQALGSRAGLGSGYMKNNGPFVEFKAVEPGYIICLFSIIPNVSYTQGIRKLYLKTRFADIYTPEFDAVGYQDLHTFEMSALGFNLSPGQTSTLPQINVANWNTVEGKHPAWIEYMTAIDESHGLMQIYGQYGYWVLNRPFDRNAYYSSESDPSRVPQMDTSTYIYPEYFTNIFAVNRNIDNFQVQMRWYDKTSQPMSKQVLPRL